MKLEKIAIANVRGFWQGFEAELDPAVTAILGRNNAGKTALLNTISSPVAINRHRGPASLSFIGATNTRDAEVRYRFVLGKNDFAQLLEGEFSIVMPGNGLTHEQIHARYAEMKGWDRITFAATVLNNSGNQNFVTVIPEYIREADNLKAATLVRFRSNPASQNGVDVIQNSGSLSR